jgi:hypothetical protein
VRLGDSRTCNCHRRSLRRSESNRSLARNPSRILANSRCRDWHTAKCICHRRRCRTDSCHDTIGRSRHRHNLGNTDRHPNIRTTHRRNNCPQSYKKADRDWPERYWRQPENGVASGAHRRSTDPKSAPEKYKRRKLCVETRKKPGIEQAGTGSRTRPKVTECRQAVSICPNCRNDVNLRLSRVGASRHRACLGVEKRLGRSVGHRVLGTPHGLALSVVSKSAKFTNANVLA